MSSAQRRLTAAAGIRQRPLNIAQSAMFLAVVGQGSPANRYSSTICCICFVYVAIRRLLNSTRSILFVSVRDCGLNYELPHSYLIFFEQVPPARFLLDLSGNDSRMPFHDF